MKSLAWQCEPVASVLGRPQRQDDQGFAGQLKVQSEILCHTRWRAIEEDTEVDLWSPQAHTWMLLSMLSYPHTYTLHTHTTKRKININYQHSTSSLLIRGLGIYVFGSLQVCGLQVPPLKSNTVIIYQKSCEGQERPRRSTNC